MKCWNPGCNIDIVKAENWTPINKLWVETGTGLYHKFKNCYRSPTYKAPPIQKPVVKPYNDLSQYYKDLSYFLHNGYPIDD